MIVGCYRPPPAIGNSMSTLVKSLSQLQYNEIVVVGDLNWDWLTPVSDAFKAQCDSLNLTHNNQIKTKLKMSSLIDLILNFPFKYSATGVFPKDVSDYSVIAAIRDTKIVKCKPCFVERHNLKMFVEQGFLWDAYIFDWARIALIDDVKMVGHFSMMPFMKF